MQTFYKYALRHVTNVNRNLLIRPYQNICTYRCYKSEIFRKAVYNGSKHVCKHLGTRKISVSSTLRRKNLVSDLNDLVKYIHDEKQFYLKLLVNILDAIKFEDISIEDARLLLECCGNSVSDSSRQARNTVCQEIYKNLSKYGKLDLSIFHTYIRICTENDIVLNCKEFLKIIPFQPCQNTYKLLLENVCEKGVIEQAFEILEIMKTKSISADEEVFNNLVLSHTVRGGLKAGESVLLTMKAAQVPETINTKYAILKGILQRDSYDDLISFLTKHPMVLSEIQLLEALMVIGLKGNILWLSQIKKLYQDINITREFINRLEKICIHLVHMNKSESAMVIYEHFMEPTNQENYGFFLLKEMLHCNVDIKTIISLAKHLRDDNLNTYALENLTAIALRHNYIEASWELLKNLPELRSHFFWPMLINANEKEGETGVFSVLKKINEMGVKIDSETLEFYVLPFCDLNNLQLLVKKLQGFGLTVKELLSTLLIVLIHNKKVKQAAELCDQYNVHIYGEKLFKLVCSTWKISKHTDSVVLLLQKYCESHETDNDLVGDFLMETLNACSTNDDFNRYDKLLKMVHERRLRISSTYADNLQNLCLTKCPSSSISEKIRDRIDIVMDMGLKSEPVYIRHPRDMNVDELECHLIELQEKNMGTRGVLRKLIQLHSNLGNLQRVEELREQFLSLGYEETIGMKSSLMHSYVKKAHIEPALNVYKQIKTVDPDFNLDWFKIIDLATLLVKENKFNDAMDILRRETQAKKALAGPAIEKNCWQLLGSFVNENEQLQMFKFLVEKRYCKPSNIILGPLVALHLNREDLQKAANTYIHCANTYKCTPMQLEIIKAVLNAEDKDLLQKILDVTQNVHGAIPTQTALIAGLAENGLEKPLRKLLANNKLYIKKELQKRCERWIKEEKMKALQTLANACERLPKEVFDVNIIYNCIMQIYTLNNDCKGAVDFYDCLLEKDIPVDKEIENQLNMLLKKCNFGRIKTSEK